MKNGFPIRLMLMGVIVSLAVMAGLSSSGAIFNKESNVFDLTPNPFNLVSVEERPGKFSRESNPFPLSPNSAETFFVGESKLFSLQDVPGKHSSGLTIITHGFIPSAFLWVLRDIAWTTNMAKTIIQKKGDGKLIYLTHEDKTARVVPIGNSTDAATNRLASTGETVVVLDWRSTSNNNEGLDHAEPGRREEAGDFLANWLLVSGLAQQAKEINAPIHFIGHSFGTVVNSEAIRRLGIHAVDVARMTTLDPHDQDQVAIPDAKDFGTKGQADEPLDEPLVKVWRNVGFADNYWEDNAGSSANRYDNTTVGDSRQLPVGHPIVNAENRDLTDETAYFKTLEGDWTPHSRVWAWYFKTILGNDYSDFPEIPGRGWYSSLIATNHGYGVSRNSDFTLLDMTMTVQSKPNPTDDPPASVFNGDFRFYDADFLSQTLPGYASDDRIGVTDSGDSKHGFVARLDHHFDIKSFRTRPVYFPTNATHLVCDYIVRQPGDGDFLVVAIAAGKVSMWIPVSAVTSRWNSFELSIPASLKGAWAEVEFGLKDPGYFQGVDSTVWVDNIRLELNSVRDTISPIVTLADRPSPVLGAPYAIFSVNYLDNATINGRTFGDANVRVTGPNGFNQLAKFESASSPSDSLALIAKYRIIGSGGTWDTDDNGTYEIRMESGQVSDSSTNFVSPGILGTFEVGFNDTQPPIVTISDPINGTRITAPQVVFITADANDNIGIRKVEFYEGTTLRKTDRSAPFNISWPLTAAENGTHTWTAKAYDVNDNPAVSGPLTVTVSIDSTPQPPMPIQPDIPQLITFNQPPNKTYGDPAFALIASASSGLPVIFTIVSGPGTISGNNMLTFTGAGAVIVRATQPGDGSRMPATPVERSFSVAKAPLIARADNKTKVEGTANPPLTITYAGFVNADTFSVLDSPPVASTTATTSSSFGTYSIVLTGGSDDNYTFTLQDGTLTISPGNRATVNIARPVPGETFIVGTNVVIEARIQHNNLNITKVEFFQGETKLGEATSGINQELPTSSGFRYSSSYTFSWSNPAAASYSLTVKATDDQGVSTTSAPTNISVTGPLSVAPAITLNPKGQTVTVGANVSFNVEGIGSPPVIYQWRKNGVVLPGANGATLTLTGVQSSDAGSYSVVLSNPAGAATSSEAILTVTIGDAPQILLQPQGQTVSVGASFTFVVTATGTQPLRFQWRSNGVDLPNQTNAALNISVVSPANGGRYSVLISNSVGSATSEDAILTVVTPPSITLQPGSQTANVGANVLFTVVAAGSEPFRYQWRFNGVDLSNQTNAVLTINPVLAESQGRYSIIVSNDAGSVTSQEALLPVITNPGGPAIALQPQNQSVNVGVTVSFNVEASGTSPITYQWQFNGTDIPGATTSALVLNGVQPSNSGSYSVVINNPGGKVTSLPAILTIRDERPANDDFAGRLIVTGAQVSTSGSNANATKEPSEPNHDGKPGLRSVWWTWTAPSSGKATVSAAGSSFDTILGVYTGLSIENLTRIASNDDDPDAPVTTSRVTFDTVAGVIYQIAVDGRGGTTGTITLTIAGDVPKLPVQISTSGKNLVLAWPKAATGIVIEESDDLKTWVPITVVPFVEGDENLVKLPILKTSKFYRLRPQ